jgi:predicted DNA-binding transcriptional regulator YafY
MRPSNYVKMDANTYIFTCTEMQAMSYFFKFGKDVKILAPEYLRERFANQYKAAWEHYQQ